MSKKTIFTFIVGIVVIVAAVALIANRTQNSGPDLTVFTQCLKDKGAVFYGAFWCTHCQATKKLFGRAADKLPYVECSTPDGNSQTQECRAKGITGYPTWIFADGSRETGELTLEYLSEKTSCPLPTATTTQK